MNKKTYIKNFQILSDVIIIESTSGAFYEIKKTSCSCKGFKYRDNCGHHREAEEKGLLNLIGIAKKKNIHSTTWMARDERKKAIRKYLQKLSITFTEKMIDMLETKVNRDMTPEEFQNLAKSLNI